MFSSIKEAESINSFNECLIPDPDQEPMFSNHSSNINSVEMHIQSISQSSDASHFTNLSSEMHKSFNFQVKALILDQLLKGFAIIYLAFGIMSATVSFLRQILHSTKIANELWNWVGSLNALLIFFNIILIFTSRIILYQNPNFRKKEKSKDNYLYLLLIVFPSGIAWLSLAFLLLRDTQYIDICSVAADIILPLSRMIFLMASITFIHDLINYKIKPCATTTFHFIYKSTAIFIFITCINNSIFEFFNSQVTNLQQVLTNSTNSSFPYCYTENMNSTFVELNKKAQPYVHIFSIISNVAAAIFLSRVIEKLYNPNKSFKLRKEKTEASDDSINPSSLKKFKISLKYLFLIIISSIVLFLLSILHLIIAIKEVGQSTVSKKQDLKIIVNAVPVFIFPIRTGLIIYMLRLLNYNFDLNYIKQTSTTPINITWVSLLGMLLSLFKNLLENISRLAKDDSTSSILINGFGIVLQIETIIEAVSQAMMIDYLLRLNWNKVIKKEALKRICYCGIPLIICNIGNICSDYYSTTGHYIFHSSSDKFRKLMWQIFISISFPFVLMFRAICPLYLILFFSNIIRKINEEI